ncbi:hypothetical protein HBI56_232900 [Parastagonospora nodorum]|uniref:Uncharacterized protein n=1 Tax=Phaeosphaeria nodorum (strain SN15 / ATCC MYA-4574 / FGSC 10173) TaxID=321614 RepID=A0A7U2F9B4_PHANO|nr:hypothetical protein HBH56_200800 [Parastagonospora nodorum]QRD00808.1 hypothetical protein JI435_415800 [Parastagonospora nodorum SN15]KAH3925751.1 hypothetical protein HBH54_175500 [Parastagonospora nodorum]KAH4051811.1 hypothetical protein HBH49_108300 [Parastagonospora nodorum]KAH4132404.1 hypothetical protein HBH45_179210 [Parastagonospora nodorum]
MLFPHNHASGCRFCAEMLGADMASARLCWKDTRLVLGEPLLENTVRFRARALCSGEVRTWWSAHGREGNGCGRAFVGVWKGAFGAGVPGWAVPLRYDVIRCWTGWFYAYFGRGISLNCA